LQVSLGDLTKKFDSTTVVDRVNLDIESGRFFCFLGPSGCGKTTTLRMIAGFENPTSGKIMFGGNDITDVPSHRRNCGMVFQNYALFPHMNVFDNVAYGLRLKRLPGEREWGFGNFNFVQVLPQSMRVNRLSTHEIERRVLQALDMVELEGFGKRMPSQLSGGQQQRVSLARALVIEPSVLLLDEPLSNLDAKLRISMRTEIKRIQKDIGITTIYVTHDQEEALSIADMLVVMRAGRVEQKGSPQSVYRTPSSDFVADFIGRTNLLKGTLVSLKPRVEIGIGKTKVFVRKEAVAEEVEVGSNVLLSVRPEALEFKKAENTINGVIKMISYLGALVRYEVETEAGKITIDIHNPESVLKEGDKVKVGFSSEECRVFRG